MGPVAVGVPVRRGKQVPFRAIFILCLAKIILVCIVSLAFQIAAIHRIDEAHPAAFLADAAPPAPRRPRNATQAARGDRPRDAPGPDGRPVVAYVVTLTGCGTDRHHDPAMAAGLITQGAAVLRQSIATAHAPGASRYGYRAYAFVHPAATACAAPLAALGYATRVRNTPFDARDIRGGFLRDHIDGASCCGRKEYIKLYAYTLVEHPVAVVLDLDSLILRPLDGLFDALLAGEGLGAGGEGSPRSAVPVHDGRRNATRREAATARGVAAFYTRDYNMVNPGGERYAGVQGGFLAVRPSEAVFEEYVALVLEGDYREGKGWAGRYGYFFGGMQIQGIAAYYYEERRHGTGVELDRCVVNAMADAPRFPAGRGAGRCRDGRADCEDCRAAAPEDVLSAHFTLCQKPWECPASWGAESARLCAGLHGAWFRTRRRFEEARTDRAGRLPALAGAWRPDTYFGYCTRPGRGGYVPLEI